MKGNRAAQAGEEGREQRPTCQPRRDLHSGEGVEAASGKGDHDHVVRHGPEVIEADAVEGGPGEVKGGQHILPQMTLSLLYFTMT